MISISISDTAIQFLLYLTFTMLHLNKFKITSPVVTSTLCVSLSTLSSIVYSHNLPLIKTSSILLLVYCCNNANGISHVNISMPTLYDLLKTMPLNLVVIVTRFAFLFYSHLMSAESPLSSMLSLALKLSTFRLNSSTVINLILTRTYVIL